MQIFCNIYLIGAGNVLLAVEQVAGDSTKLISKWPRGSNCYIPQVAFGAPNLRRCKHLKDGGNGGEIRLPLRCLNVYFVHAFFALHNQLVEL